MQPNSLIESTSAGRSIEVIRISAGQARFSGTKRLVTIALLSVAFSSLANHALADWLGLSRSAPWTRANALYRRIGPLNGGQVLCAGSSLLESALSWPGVSKSLGEGIEDWTVSGSSPEVWGVFQKQARNVNITIVGVSVYDLNEMRLTPERASFVPLRTTLADLWTSRTDPDLRHRILMQYAVLYARVLYPTAGDGGKVLVGLRSKAADVLGQEGRLEQWEGIVVEKKDVLGIEDDGTSLRDWSAARVLRRLDALREDNHGSHKFFDGPKGRALRGVLLRAQQQGRVIVVVLPVSQCYADAFLDEASITEFERTLRDDMAVSPEAILVRLDQVPDISDNKNFLDPVHLNSSGRRILTPIFLKQVNKGVSKPKPRLTSPNAHKLSK